MGKDFKEGFLEKLTYKQCAATLRKAYDTITQAVERGSLTKCVSRTERPYLHKEQVLLFLNKPAISVRYLSQEEYTQWKAYKKEALQVGLPTIIHNPQDPITPDVANFAAMVDGYTTQYRNGILPIQDYARQVLLISNTVTSLDQKK